MGVIGTLELNAFYSVTQSVSGRQVPITYSLLKRGVCKQESQPTTDRYPSVGHITGEPPCQWRIWPLLFAQKRACNP
jgi:hypothetical protein